MRLYGDLMETASTLLDLLNGVFGGVEGWLYAQLAELNVPTQVQLFLLIALWVLVAIVMLRLTRSFVRLLVGLVLVLFLLHLARPLLGI